MRTCTVLSMLLLFVALAPPGHPAQSDDVDRPAPGEPLFTKQEKSYWAFQPVTSSQPPAVRVTGWLKSPLDQFVLASLETSGLDPAPAANKRTLIRRATFDLTGLPPTPEEIDAFLADESPDAFAKVVDRLLASPHYGERWGRHWLDVARYADSNGMDENLAYANAFRYRDYVIAAFNQDKPYDLFVREQLAGDLLPPTGDSATDAGRLVATGFLSIGPKMLAEDDPVKMEMDIIDEQLDTIGRTFMGLTLGCARCHNHKFDPIRTEDYYSLAGIFKSTQTMDNFKVVARWHERPLGSKDAVARQEAHQQQVAAKKSTITRLADLANQAILRKARHNVAGYLLAAAEIQRQNALEGDLRPVMADPPTESTLGVLIVEAENFARGNARREFTGYGEKIGVIYNQGQLPNFAEYEITVTEGDPNRPGRSQNATPSVAMAPAYQLELRYAAAEARPVKLFVNGQLVKANAAAKTTGSWYPDTQTWSAEVVFSLPGGKNTIRLERAEPFPHFDKFALIPRTSATGAVHAAPQTPEQLASEHDLNPELLRQWVRYLEQTRSDPASVLYGWHALTTVAPAASAGDLFNDLKGSVARGLAARYQELFDEADRAWRELQASQADAKELPDAVQESLRKVLYDPKGPFALPPKPEPYYPAETRDELERLRDDLAKFEQLLPALPEAIAVAEGKPENLRLHIRGNHLTLGQEVPRQFPRVIAGEQQAPIDDAQSGRLQLADWLTRSDHPLTARVMVNRIWRWHFGAGLVRTPDNFGRLGEPPTHPLLLDWLARRFIDAGWSVKAMHRLIMLSSTYQMSTAYNEKAAGLDPENRLLWRMNRRRLEAEIVRDAILSVSGQLDRTMGGSLFQGGNRAYVPGYPNATYDKYDFVRRSVYLPIIRSDVYDAFQAFDFADPSVSNGDRATTTVAPQALFMMNSRLIRQQTQQMAAGLLACSEIDDTARVGLAHERVLGRPATNQETDRALEFIRKYETASDNQQLSSDERRLRAWQAFCRTILASNEFVYVE